MIYRLARCHVKSRSRSVCQTLIKQRCPVWSQRHPWLSSSPPGFPRHLRNRADVWTYIFCWVTLYICVCVPRCIYVLCSQKLFSGILLIYYNMINMTRYRLRHYGMDALMQGLPFSIFYPYLTFPPTCIIHNRQESLQKWPKADCSATVVINSSCSLLRRVVEILQTGNAYGFHTEGVGNSAGAHV